MTSFNPGKWESEVDVNDFILQNITSYSGDETFLTSATTRTQNLMIKVKELVSKENEKGILDLDTKIPSSITSHSPGYLDKENELIVGFQTDAPLKRGILPNGGIKLVERAANSYGYEIDTKVVDIFTKYRKTHNDGVFSVYTPQMKKLRSKHVLTGLPDNYSRGRIIGDYRRVALYGVDFLIEDRNKYLSNMDSVMSEENIRKREEVSEQIKALEDLKTMALSYGYDISKPATNTKEAIQWIYFAYLGVIKQQDGAAMSIWSS